MKLCLLYTSDAADDMQCVDLGGRRSIKKKIFGAPTFVVNNKNFWGQDRFEYAIEEFNSTS